ncbi:MAG: DUF3417 domain-containing protein, partial [Gemmatimonadetes bacterium]|nr:DUF3417 domain-containing protein [Gemmatimonadota bacterium]
MSQGTRGVAYLPEAIHRISDVASNLYWAWSHPAREMFKRIDPTLWSRVRHDPLALLRGVEPARLAACGRDPEFLALYRAALDELDRLSTREGTWFARSYPDLSDATIAYFCAEFGVHNSVPIYSGGLGVLAGDHSKEASDLGLDFV